MPEQAHAAANHWQQLAGPLHQHLAGTPLAHLSSSLATLADQQANPARNGNLRRWRAVLGALPPVPRQPLAVHQGRICAGAGDQLDPGTHSALAAGLMALQPWRKGPFDLFGIQVDAEWRSQLKWQRVAPHLSALPGRSVLDVGCGNGWYALQMSAAGARLVLGVDPGLGHLMQFLAVQHCLQPTPVQLLPLPLELLPEPARDSGEGPFDTVLSMGVLYHRRNPLEHLRQLRAQLRSGGELLLETLVVPGDVNTLLCPPGRYAGMRNVWFLPSVLLLERWLERLGLTQIRCVDQTSTGSAEQRSTSWSPGHSLANALTAEQTRTIEGHPAPLRATVLATAP